VSGRTSPPAGQARSLTGSTSSTSRTSATPAPTASAGGVPAPPLPADGSAVPGAGVAPGTAGEVSAVPAGPTGWRAVPSAVPGRVRVSTSGRPAETSASASASA
jgi:hypothetical protein